MFYIKNQENWEKYCFSRWLVSKYLRDWYPNKYWWKKSPPERGWEMCLAISLAVAVQVFSHQQDWERKDLPCHCLILEVIGEFFSDCLYCGCKPHISSGNPSHAMLSYVLAHGTRWSLSWDFISKWGLKTKAGKDVCPSWDPVTKSLGLSQINQCPRLLLQVVRQRKV